MANNLTQEEMQEIFEELSNSYSNTDMFLDDDIITVSKVSEYFELFVGFDFNYPKDSAEVATIITPRFDFTRFDLKPELYEVILDELKDSVSTIKEIQDDFKYLCNRYLEKDEYLGD